MAIVGQATDPASSVSCLQQWQILTLVGHVYTKHYVTVVIHYSDIPLAGKSCVATATLPQ